MNPMMSNSEFLAITIGMVVITFGLRFAVLGAAGNFEMPKKIQKGLGFVPVAVLSALIVSSTFITQGQVTHTLLDPKILAFIVCVLVSLRFGLISTVVCGMGSLWLFQWLIGMLH
ncbi:AzlD domain-containing protein [Dongshaea marina]|uniref:AzlD domain-containing protein n=1 Tax=Dongshaea marina TaxID=2047966 RepID=UPI0019018617|nr:AzlD domain-containing protein [Dongshaea marina]